MTLGIIRSKYNLRSHGGSEMKKRILVIIGLMLVAVGPAATEVIYSDGWVPPRLVDGVWVSSGVSDEVAKDYAALIEQEKVQKEARQRRLFVENLFSYPQNPPAAVFPMSRWNNIGGYERPDNQWPELPGAAFVGEWMVR